MILSLRLMTVSWKEWLEIPGHTRLPILWMSEKGNGEPDQTTIPMEFLRAQNPSSLPPAKLKLKVGCPIILLRNLFPEGLCNGSC